MDIAFVSVKSVEEFGHVSHLWRAQSLKALQGKRS